MNCVQPSAKLAYFLGHLVAKIGGQMPKSFLYPLRDGFATAANHDCPDSQCDYDSNQQKTALAESLVILRMRNRGQRARQEDSQYHQRGERSDIEDPLHGPRGQLRREGKIRPSRD
jgi:hypothetical protein